MIKVSEQRSYARRVALVKMATPLRALLQGARAVGRATPALGRALSSVGLGKARMQRLMSSRSPGAYGRFLESLARQNARVDGGVARANSALADYYRAGAVPLTGNISRTPDMAGDTYELSRFLSGGRRAQFRQGGLDLVRDDGLTLQFGRVGYPNGRLAMPRQ